MRPRYAHRESPINGRATWPKVPSDRPSSHKYHDVVAVRVSSIWPSRLCFAGRSWVEFTVSKCRQGKFGLCPCFPVRRPGFIRIGLCSCTYGGTTCRRARKHNTAHGTPKQLRTQGTTDHGKARHNMESHDRVCRAQQRWNMCDNPLATTGGNWYHSTTQSPGPGQQKNHASKAGFWE